MWRQKSSVQWLVAPNLNTKFFHLTTSMRGRKNPTDFLKNSDRT